jgi:hypothetical protein
LGWDLGVCLVLGELGEGDCGESGAEMGVFGVACGVEMREFCVQGVLGGIWCFEEFGEWLYFLVEMKFLAYWRYNDPSYKHRLIILSSMLTLILFSLMSISMAFPWTFAQIEQRISLSWVRTLAKSNYILIFYLFWDFWKLATSYPQLHVDSGDKNVGTGSSSRSYFVNRMLDRSIWICFCIVL